MFDYWKRGPSAYRGIWTSTWSKLAIALLIGGGIGIAYAPVTGLGQGKVAKQVPEVPPGCKRLIGGDDIALVRVVKQSGPADDRVANYANGTTAVDELDPPGVNFTINDNPSNPNIEVTATLPRSYLSTQGTPLKVISAGVVVQAGSSSCYWDCYWVNGKKICECIQL